MNISVICVIKDQPSEKQTSFVKEGERVCAEQRLDLNIRFFNTSEYRHDREITTLPAFHVYDKKRIVGTFYNTSSIERYIIQKRKEPVSLFTKLVRHILPKSPFSRA